MEDLTIAPPALVVKHTGNAQKGHGAYAAKDFKAGETVEVSLVRFLWKPEIENIRYYDDRIYSWGDRLGKDPRLVAMAQGYGSQYNHAQNPNMTYYPLENPDRMVFKAVRSIPAGEELTINYREKAGVLEIGSVEKIILKQRRAPANGESTEEESITPQQIRFEVDTTTDGIAEILMQEIHRAVENKNPELVVQQYQVFLENVAPKVENTARWAIFEDANASLWSRLEAFHNLIAPHAKIRLQGGIEEFLRSKVTKRGQDLGIDS